MIFIVRIVQHGVEMNFVDTRNRADIAGQSDIDPVVGRAVDLQ